MNTIQNKYAFEGIQTMLGKVKSIFKASGKVVQDSKPKFVTLMPEVPHKINKRYLSPEEIKALCEKSTREAITKMNAGDKAVKTQKYYDELLNNMFNSGSDTVSYFNPRTGGWTVYKRNNPRIVQVFKGSATSPSGYAKMISIYDRGELGLYRATRNCELPNDGFAYNTPTNSILQKFNKESGKWEDLRSK